jgi:hypothetical protein
MRLSAIRKGLALPIDGYAGLFFVAGGIKLPLRLG